MPRAILLHPHFEADVQQAADWYHQQSPGLGDVLLSTMNARVQEIIQQPERFAWHTAGCRYSKIAKFPYVLLFNVTDEFVELVSFVHVSRSDEKLRERFN